MKQLAKKTFLLLSMMIVFGAFWFVKPQTTQAAAYLDTTRLIIPAGNGYSLNVKGTNAKVTWTTTDKSIVKVDKEGYVKGVKAGKATIKAKVGKKTLKCRVTVKKKNSEKVIGPPIVEDEDETSLILNGFGFTCDSVNGVKLLWEGENLSGKTINYYDVGIAFINPVGDPAYDEITGYPVNILYYVGPVEPGEALLVYDMVGYVPLVEYVRILEIVLTYDDGTVEVVEYGYEASEFYE